MTLDGLSHDEKLVLVALVEAVAMSNGIVSEGEIRGIGKIVEEIGEDDYRKLMDEADTKFDNLDDLKGSLSSIKGEACEIIYGTVWEASQLDPDVNHSETELLDWLKNAWSIE